MGHRPLESIWFGLRVTVFLLRAMIVDGRPSRRRRRDGAARRADNDCGQGKSLRRGDQNMRGLEMEGMCLLQEDSSDLSSSK